MSERNPFIVIPRQGDSWPDRTQEVEGQKYRVLGGGIYMPEDATVAEVQKLYSYWALEHSTPYDEQNAWISEVGRNCADIVRQHIGSSVLDAPLLDLACGTGLVSVGVRQRMQVAGGHVCLDITPAMLVVLGKNMSLRNALLWMEMR